MAKKKKQRAPVNPELTKVKSVFQRNVDMAYKVQRTHKSDFVERYDLTDVYCKRRIKAVMNLLPKFKERYRGILNSFSTMQLSCMIDLYSIICIVNAFILKKYT